MNEKTQAFHSISRPTIQRLPLYMPLLRSAFKQGRETISSSRIAESLGFEAIQVRKDLASIGITGLPKVGFPVVRLIEAIEYYLGWDNVRDAFVVGAGNLGAALAGYDGFEDRGLRIVGLFDSNPKKIGTVITDKPVVHIDKLENLIGRMHVHIAILTVPSAAAQTAADQLVNAGIRAIWNFTPTKLNLPEDIIVERMDLAASLAVLSSKLASKRYIQTAGTIPTG